MLRLIAAVAVLQAGVAYGQSDRDEEAHGLYLAGQSAYDAARYGDALGYFEQSHALSGRPELLFNMGHAAQLDGQVSRAIDAFERYLEEAPNGEKRDDVEERLQSLRERSAHQEAEDESGAEDSVNHTPALALGVGGAALVAGGGVMLGLMAGQQSNVRNAEDGTPWADVQDNHDRARTFRTVGISLLSVGAVLAGVGLSLWLARRAQVDVSAQGIRVSGSF